MTSTPHYGTYNFDDSEKNGIIVTRGGYKNFSQDGDADENVGGYINRLVVIWTILCLNHILHKLLLWSASIGWDNKQNGGRCQISPLEHWANYSGYDENDGLQRINKLGPQKWYISIQDLF